MSLKKLIQKAKVLDEEQMKKLPADAIVVVTRIPADGKIPDFDPLGYGANIESKCSECGSRTYERPYNPKQCKRVCLECLLVIIEKEKKSKLQ